MNNLIISQGKVKPLLLPEEFQLGWGLSPDQAAKHLGITTQAFRTYTFRPDSPSRRVPREPIRLAASLQTRLWLLEGRQPVVPRFLFE